MKKQNIIAREARKAEVKGLEEGKLMVEFRLEVHLNPWVLPELDGQMRLIPIFAKRNI